MAKKENTSVKNKMVIYSDFDESPSGHYESRHCCELLADNHNHIILKESFEKTNYLKFDRSEKSETSYKIGVQDLINLIKKHGTKMQR